MADAPPQEQGRRQGYSPAFYHYLRWLRAAGLCDWGVAALPPQKRKSAPLASSPPPLKKEVPDNDSLERLEKDLRAFEECPLKQFAMNTVFARGNADASVMCVGEAPGGDEDREGKPFVGRSGRLLDMMLASIGLSPDMVRIGNIVPWRPPGNRTPSQEEIDICLPFIRRHIALVRPRVLIFLGNVASASLLQSKDGISRLRGRWHDYHFQEGAPPIKARPMFHPAYLLRSPLQKKLAWHDLCAIKEELEQD